MTSGTGPDTGTAHRAIEAVWRLESARIIAGVAGLVRDVGQAEELAQDALVAALEQWPAEGIPANPGGWLMLTARHRAIDRIRRNERLAGKLNLLGRDLETAQHDCPPEFDDVLDEGKIDDDLLRLMFISCHPVLSTEARIALTLRLLGGLTTEEIARGFLAAEPAIAKRIVRAKQTLASRQVPFEVPPPADRPARLASVLEVLYLVFNEGYSAMAGDDWMRPALCTEALRLGSDTDWKQIATLYQALAVLAPSPVVELNRAVAVAMADGPERGLEIVDGLAAEPALAGYHHLPSVRGDLLTRLGRYREAASEFRRAASLTRNIAERTVLLQRAAECDAPT